MNKLIDFLNNEEETLTILNDCDIDLMPLMSDYCGFCYEILGNSSIRVMKHNVATKYQVLSEPVPGCFYVGDNLYVFKVAADISTDALFRFMSNFKTKVSDEMYHFITLLNSVNGLDILSENKHAMKAIEKYPQMKVKKIRNFYLTYVEVENKILVIGLINMIAKVYFVVNMYAFGSVNSLKISKKFKTNKCSPTCKNTTHPFCPNDHGKKNHLYCVNQLEYLYNNGFCDFIMNRFMCPNACCQGYHIFRVSSPNNYDMKKSL